VTITFLAAFPSPSRGVWHLGVIPIRAYALCIVTGIIAALLIGDRRWQARGGERGIIYDIALWAVPFGLIGGRLYHLITDWRTYFGEGGDGFWAALKIWDGGLGIWGAVALGGVGAWIGCRRRGIPLPAFGDAIAPGIILAQAIGRIGNYFNQELYGRETTVPWGLEIFYRRDPSGLIDPYSVNGVSTGQVYQVVHPTFLYELLWNLLVFALLLYVDRRFKLGHGRLFALYVASYCAGRFWVELMRSDAATHIAGIRVNSFTSTFVFIGAVVYILVAPKGREDPSTLGGPAEAEAPQDSPVDAVAKELVGVAATSGVVAAVTVAGQEDAAAEPAAAEPEASDEPAEPATGEAKSESPAAEDVVAGDEPAATGDTDAEAAEASGTSAAAESADQTHVAAVGDAEPVGDSAEAAPEADMADAESGVVESGEVESGEVESGEVEPGAVGSGEEGSGDESEAVAEQAADESAVAPDGDAETVEDEPEPQAADGDAQAEPESAVADAGSGEEPEVAVEEVAESGDEAAVAADSDGEAGEEELEPEAADAEPVEDAEAPPEPEREFPEPESAEPESAEPESAEPEGESETPTDEAAEAPSEAATEGDAEPVEDPAKGESEHSESDEPSEGGEATVDSTAETVVRPVAVRPTEHPEVVAAPALRRFRDRFRGRGPG
jgi:prolipoprotein diacylglyceryl transferase